MSVSSSPKEEREQFSFTEYPSIVQALDELAEDAGTSRAALIRRGIRLILASQKPKVIDQTMLETQSAGAA